jgi:hypothetical protein
MIFFSCLIIELTSHTSTDGCANDFDYFKTDEVKGNVGIDLVAAWTVPCEKTHVEMFSNQYR